MLARYKIDSVVPLRLKNNETELGLTYDDIHNLKRLTNCPEDLHDDMIPADSSDFAYYLHYLAEGSTYEFSFVTRAYDAPTNRVIGWSLFHTDPYGDVNVGLYVDIKRRREGIGTALFAKVKEFCIINASTSNLVGSPWNEIGRKFFLKQNLSLNYSQNIVSFNEMLSVSSG